MPDITMPTTTTSERRALDTMSETSECTTTTTTSGKSGFDNREDLKDLAAKLGIMNLEDMHQERFRVDRRKLEHMLLGVPIGDNETPELAETFFHKVMEETNTWVTWPSRLKIGAKSKKDPHIKVAGRPDDVRACKEKIMEILDTRQNNRVTMKLDVSYTDHSHIIGKGGLTIKKVMEETGCHIHFPDSNRSNHQEKSNQVSIAGEMENVERARAKVRNLTPLIFSFELPVMNTMQHQTPDATSPYIVKIQEKYNVQVMFRTRPKLHSSLVLVKGCEWEVSQVKEATVLLINDMCKSLANQIQVHMSMEISPQHHSIVLGKQSQNLKMIMERTGTQIMFPDAGDPNIPSLKKSSVTITGSIHNVYLARQQLVGSLPLVLMFDLPEESIGSVETDRINSLMQSLDVFINIRHKPKQSTLSVIIKGIERNASNIYEARKHLLKLDEPRVHAEIPATYHIPNASVIFQNNSSNLNGLITTVPENFSTTLSVNTQNSPYCMSPLQSPNPLNLSPHWGFPSIPSMFSQMPFNHTGYGPYSSLSHMLTTQHMLQNGMLGHPGLANANFSGFNPMHALNAGLHGLNNIGVNTLADNKDSGAFSSLSSATSSLSSPALSPRNISPVNADGAPALDLSLMFDLSVNDRRAPGCEKKSLELASQHLTPFDYEQKKLLAIKAMQSKIDPKISRNPTSSWVGYGLSHSSPSVAPGYKESKSDLWNDPSTPVFNTTMDFDVNPSRLGMVSNHLDHTPSSVVNKMTQNDDSNDVATILAKIGVQKYMHLFIENEIDMATFQTLTENDLYEIGITAWGARRRILLKIAELNSRSSTFSGSAAPGAERRMSSTATTTSNTLTSGKFSSSISGSNMEKW